MACATFPLIWVGGLVTTTKAGMAVPDWPTTYGYNMFLYPWQSWIAGPWDRFVEHGHRLLGAAVGLVALALAAALWLTKARAGLRWLGSAAVAAVIFQGLLGGLRVVFDSRWVGQVHGTFGPLFFALTVALAAVTSQRWSERTSLTEAPGLGRVRRLAFISAFLAWLQIAIGARLRHMPVAGSTQEFQAVVAFHLFLAAALLGHVALLAARVWRLAPAAPGLAVPAAVLSGLMFLQIGLGVFTWVEKHGWPAMFSNYAWAESHIVANGSLRQSLVLTGHVATGSLILATTLLVGLRSIRRGQVAGALSSSAPERPRTAGVSA